MKGNLEETLSVIGSKTSFNNSDAALIATEHAKPNTSVSAVYVMNMRGQTLMPIAPRKAKKLLKEDKAKVIRRTPFTIQLKYATGETKQPIILGVDRSHIKNTATRFIHGFQRFDKVLWNNIECFVFGRRKTGYFELRKLDGTKIHASAKAKELTLLETANTFLISNLRLSTLLPTLNNVVSTTTAPHGIL